MRIEEQCDDNRKPTQSCGNIRMQYLSKEAPNLGERVV